MSDVAARTGGQPEASRADLRPWPDNTERDAAAVTAVLRMPASDQGGPDSTVNRRFEADVSAYLGGLHCHGVASGTDAIRVALVAAGVQPGHNVIMPAFGWPSAALMVRDIGAVPRWVDIDARTWTLDVDQVEGLIDERTAAIMTVHTHGLIPDSFARLLKIAQRHGLPVVEDACQAIGARLAGLSPGAGPGRIAALSLNVQKPLQGGSGGLVVTTDAGLAEAAYRYAELGEPPDGAAGPVTRRRGMRVSWRGITSRLHPMAAALAGSQLPRLNGYLARARENAAILTEGLRELPGVILADIPDPRQTTYHLFRVQLDPEAAGWDVPPEQARDWLASTVRACGVGAEQWQRMATSDMPAFRRGDRDVWTPVRSDDPGGMTEPFDPDAMPVTRRLMASSIVIGRCPHPLQVQEPDTMRAYVRAFRKAWETGPREPSHA